MPTSTYSETPRFKLTRDLTSSLLTLDSICSGAWAPRYAAISGLDFAYYGGTAYNPVGPVEVYVPDGIVTVADDAVSYVQRTTAGVVSASVTLDPDKLLMAIVTAASGAITDFEDVRDLALSLLRERIADLQDQVDGIGTSTGTGGGGAVFPDDAGTFGTTAADDEEFETSLASFTIETDVGGGNTRTLNGAFGPSRLVMKIVGTATASDVLSLYRVLATSTGDLSLTCDPAGVFDQNFKLIEVGYRSSTATSAAAMVCSLGYSSGQKITMRKYTDIGAGTFTEPVSEAQSAPEDPKHLYLHLQRVSNVWSLWKGRTGSDWTRVTNNTSTDSFTVSHLWVRLAGFGAVNPGSLALNWIRVNRFFL